MQQRPPGQQLVQGCLRLGFMYDHERQVTRLTVHEQRPPLQVVRAFPLVTGGTLLHLHNLSGGVLGGDQFTIDVDAGPQTRVQITSTSATRLYRHRACTPPARQTSTIRVKEGALLEYLPDPLIPFAGSRYQQYTHIELGQDAGLFWWETIAPGRSARGEYFAYDLLQLELTILALERPIAIERLKLEPGCRPLTSPARLGPYQYFTSFYICRAGLPASRWAELEQQLNILAQQLTHPGTITWGVSALVAHGLVVRAASQQGHDITNRLLAFWRAAKRALYEEEAIPPRKVY
ncbi:MAG: urease accessory protein UreD [Ktedonobacteraceae bacterium]|nr:urease accessory protein UreD [Ktedonobacteraceae bacterium]